MAGSRSAAEHQNSGVKTMQKIGGKYQEVDLGKVVEPKAESLTGKGSVADTARKASRKSGEVISDLD